MPVDNTDKFPKNARFVTYESLKEAVHHALHIKSQATAEQLIACHKILLPGVGIGVAYGSMSERYAAFILEAPKKEARHDPQGA